MINSLLPHPPHQGAKIPNVDSSAVKGQKVYVLRDGQLCALPVTTGLTDGLHTEVTGTGLEPDMNVVTEMTIGKQK